MRTYTQCRRIPPFKKQTHAHMRTCTHAHVHTHTRCRMVERYVTSKRMKNMLPSKERSLFSARWREEVALGTKVAGKRVASKCIRQICILDPWHNNTRVLNNAIQSETLHAIIWKKKKTT